MSLSLLAARALTFEPSLLAENWHKKFQHNKCFNFFFFFLLNLDPGFIWFNLIMSEALATSISSNEGVLKIAEIGENERDEIILFAADY